MAKPTNEYANKTKSFSHRIMLDRQPSPLMAKTTTSGSYNMENPAPTMGELLSSQLLASYVQTGSAFDKESLLFNLTLAKLYAKGTKLITSRDSCHERHTTNTYIMVSRKLQSGGTTTLRTSLILTAEARQIHVRRYNIITRRTLYGRKCGLCYYCSRGQPWRISRNNRTLCYPVLSALAASVRFVSSSAPFLACDLIYSAL